MELVRRACSSLKTTWLESFVRRPLTLGPGDAFISFTFDDVPRSAVTNAIPVLEEFGIEATLYIALGMSDPEAYCNEADVKLLASRGHQIACHTLTHYSLRGGSVDGLARNAVAGRRALESLLDGHPVGHFAYPYGEVSLRAKQRLQPEFASMRTSTPGVNAGTIDRNFLRAENLYSARLDLRRLRIMLTRLGREGGWLIFYTHDVDGEPGPFGTSTSDFRTVVEAAARSGARIATVAEALTSIESGKTARRRH